MSQHSWEVMREETDKDHTPGSNSARNKHQKSCYDRTTQRSFHVSGAAIYLTCVHSTLAANEFHLNSVSSERAD